MSPKVKRISVTCGSGRGVAKRRLGVGRAGSRGARGRYHIPPQVWQADEGWSDLMQQPPK